MAKMGRGACCCPEIGDINIGDISLENMFESMYLIPYCDPDTGVRLGYRSAIRTEETTPVNAVIEYDVNLVAAPLPQNAVPCPDAVGVIPACKVCYEPDGLIEATQGDWALNGENLEAQLDANGTIVNVQLGLILGASSQILAGGGPCNAPNGGHVDYVAGDILAIQVTPNTFNPCIEIWNLGVGVNPVFPITPTSSNLAGPGAWSEFCFEGSEISGLSVAFNSDGCYGFRITTDVITEGNAAVSEAFGYYIPDTNTMVFRDCVTGAQIDPDTIIPCPETLTIRSEIGCISSPASVDLSRAERCAVSRVRIGDDNYFINLAENWTVSEFVVAINEATGLETLQLQNGTVVLQPGVAMSTLEIFCDDPIFGEDFGFGGQDGARIATPATDYTFDNTGAILDGNYAITSFQDTGLALFNNNEANIVADSQGDANGNAFIVNADFAPGEFFRQSIEGLTINEDVSVSFFAICTNVASGVILPNIRVNIEDPNNGNAVIETFETGDLPNTLDGNWVQIVFDFSSPVTEVDFVLVNNSPGGNGNDLAIDQIQFNTVTRQFFVLEPRGVFIPVEIVKRIRLDGTVSNVRVWSPDGQIGYDLPLPGTLVLSTGPCNPPSEREEDESCCYVGDSCYQTEELLPLQGPLSDWDIVSVDEMNLATPFNFQGDIVNAQFTWLLGSGVLDLTTNACANPAAGITAYLNRTGGAGNDTWGLLFDDTLTNVLVEVWDLGPGESIAWGDAPDVTILNGANAWSRYEWNNAVVTGVTGVFDIDCITIRVSAQRLGLSPRRQAKTFLTPDGYEYRDPISSLILDPNDIVLCGDLALDVTDLVLTAGQTLTISNALSYSVLIEAGTATINGAARPEGYSVGQPPQSYGETRLIYPDITIDDVTDTVHITLVTEG